LDAVEVGKKAGMPITPIMIYGEDVSHVVTEVGIAYQRGNPETTSRE
jgi:malonate decarboxylase alpha subunit